MNEYNSWRKAPLVLDHVLHQTIHCCWSIGFTRQCTAMARLTGLIDHTESLSIQYLINGVDRTHIKSNGALDHPLNVRSFLMDQGTILDHLCPLSYELPEQAAELNDTWDVTRFKVNDLIVHTVVDGNIEAFYNQIIRCLKLSPVSIAMPCFESFKNIGNEIYIPSFEELSNPNSFMAFHVMLCTGIGTENGITFVELQDSAGLEQGVDGFVRVILQEGVLTHLIEITGIYSTQVNPNPKMVFNDELAGDKSLYKICIRTCKAHLNMLSSKEHITVADKDLILGGLEKIEEQIASNDFTYYTDIEHVHVNIERALTLLVGEPAKKLLIAHSLNDRIPTVFKIWCMEAIDAICRKIINFKSTLTHLAQRNRTLIIPLQRSQSVLLPQVILTYIEQLHRDGRRYDDCKMRHNLCPLGACDLAGTYLPIDRKKMAIELGFTGPMRNSIDAVSDRDFVLEFLNVNSTTAIHLSRLGEDWALWASEEFGFIIPGGHSIHQKMLPHPMEVVRKKAAQVTGCLMSVLKSNPLPFTYKQDFLEDRKAMFESFRLIVGMIEICDKFAQHVRFNEVRIKESLLAGRHVNANTLGAFIVKMGHTYTQSLNDVDKVVTVCGSRGRRLEDVSIEELKSWFPTLDDEGLKKFLVDDSINEFSSEGSTGPSSVDEQIDFWMS